jgi:hypothetical protein
MVVLARAPHSCRAGHTVRNDFRLPMSVVVRAYQEPAVVAAAIESWLANAVDVSDTTCREIARRYPVTVVMTDVPGKRDATPQEVDRGDRRSGRSGRLGHDLGPGRGGRGVQAVRRPSTFPNRWKIFFRQRLRWAGNTWRSDLRALSRRWVWRHLVFPGRHLPAGRGRAPSSCSPRLKRAAPRRSAVSQRDSTLPMGEPSALSLQVEDPPQTGRVQPAPDPGGISARMTRRVVRVAAAHLTGSQGRTRGPAVRGRPAGR